MRTAHRKHTSVTLSEDILNKLIISARNNYRSVSRELEARLQASFGVDIDVDISHTHSTHASQSVSHTTPHPYTELGTVEAMTFTVGSDDGFIPDLLPLYSTKYNGNEVLLYYLSDDKKIKWQDKDILEKTLKTTYRVNSAMSTYEFDLCRDLLALTSHMSITPLELLSSEHILGNEQTPDLVPPEYEDIYSRVKDWTRRTANEMSGTCYSLGSHCDDLI